MQKPKRINLIFTFMIIFLLMTIAVFILSPTVLFRVQRFFLGQSLNSRFTESSEYDLDLYQLSEQIDWVQNQSLLLVNHDHPIPDNFEPKLAEYRDSGVLMNEAMLKAYGELSDSVLQETGIKMYVSSLYRSSEEQAEIFAEDPEYAMPSGYSEHHTGLAVDVYVDGFGGINFIDSPAGQFVNQNAPQFGFIVRYPEGKEDITKIPFEPWHLRYVGFPHSMIMANKFLTLEEYIDSLEIGKIYQNDNYIVSRQNPDEPMFLPDNMTNVTYSFDNTGYIIITAIINE